MSSDREDDESSAIIVDKFKRKLVTNSGRDSFRPFKARVIEAAKLLIGPSPTVASYLTLPVDAEVMVLAARSEFRINWYKVSYMRREGWVIST